MNTTDDIRITGITELTSPQSVMEALPVSESARAAVTNTRRAVSDILKGDDDRLVVVVGPCSIHDPDAALEYASKLREQQKAHEGELCIIMRVYFEKPRTTVGWKGLINDPDMDDSFQINKGVEMARSLLLEINNLGLPAGFKNGTAGSVQIAVDAIGAAKHSHNFLSVTKEGKSAIFRTAGNQDCHLILRGGKTHTNYDAASVDDACAMLAKAGLSERVMIDCSHANSRKLHRRQSYVCRDICAQVSDGDKRIIGVMIESNLVEGNQSPSAKPLVRGQSVTDACVSWDDTLPMLDKLSAAVKTRRAGA